MLYQQGGGQMGRLLGIVLFFPLVVFANYESVIIETNKGEISNEVLIAQAWIESSMRPRIKSHMDCLGLMQIHLDTAIDMGFKGKEEDLYDPVTNIKYSIKYMYWLYKRYKGHRNRLYTTLDAYNRGIGNVKKWPWKHSWKKHKYVTKVLKKMMELRRSDGSVKNGTKGLPKLQTGNN